MKAINPKLVIIASYLFRLLAGLTSDFWDGDNQQVYLIGLKYYSTHIYPYYGPDVVYTHTQMPGGMQGILAGGPFFLLPIPEAPLIFLSVISFLALCFLFWYLQQRIALPKPFLWCAIMFAPWTLHFGTFVCNPSYVLGFSILFFIAIWELFPIYEQKVIPRKLCYLLAGLPVTAIMQLHMSYVMLFPFLLVMYYFEWKQKRLLTAVLYSLVGMLLGGLTLIPTLLQNTYDGGDTSANIVFNTSNIKELPLLVTRFMSYAAYEVPYLVGGSDEERIAFLKTYWWAAPATLICLVVGLAQAGFYIFGFFWRKSVSPILKKVNLFVGLSIMMLYVSFLFSVKGPASHTFYLLFPVALWYALYQYERLLALCPVAYRYFTWFFIIGLVYQSGLMCLNYNERSLYKNRGVVVKAIEEKNYKIFGIRRPEEWGTKGY